MARSSLCITSILLLSLVIFASAHDYVTYDTKPDLQKPKPEDKQKYVPTKPEYKQPKPEGKEKILHKKQEYEQPKSEEKVKFVPTKPNYEQPKSSEEKIKYVPTKPNYEQPKKPAEEKEKNLPKKPEYEKPKPEGKEKFLPKNSKPEKEKTLPTKPNYEQQPKPNEEEKPVPTKPDYEGTRTIAVQGLVLCKSGLKYFPIQGAVARITCLVEIDYQEGYSTTSFSIKTKPSDAKGYFYATLTPSGLGDVNPDQCKLKDCKAYLDHSPLNTCNAPTNINDGIRGDLLTSYSILKHSNTKLFSAGPFFYTSSSEPNSSAPNYGY